MLPKLLELFFIFFKIGLFTFGGGYAMIPLIKQQIVDEHQFISHEMLLDFMAVAESTPGPFAINTATFIGTETYGVLGAVFATLGVVLPSFIIILLIAVLGSKIIKSRPFQNILKGIKPCVCGLIIGAGFTVSLKNFFPKLELSKNLDFSGFDYISLILTIFILVLSNIKFKDKKKKLSPVILILIGAVLGLVVFGTEYLITNKGV
jgi:chromate transporter